MTQLLTLIGLATSIVKNWLGILKDVGKEGFVLFPSKTRKFIQKGDEYDLAGLYDKALIQFNKALSIDHRNVRAYLRKINVLIRLLRFSEASALLSKADRFAKKPKDWFWISNLRFVIQMEDFRQSPSLNRLEIAQNHLEEAELEHEDLILFGRFITSSLEALWLLPNLETDQAQKLESTAMHYLARMSQANDIESGQKYFNQFSREIKGYLKRMDLEKLSRQFFWKNYLEENDPGNVNANNFNHNKHPLK